MVLVADEWCLPQVPNLKQKRNVRLLSKLMGVPTPDVEAMTWMEAERFIGVQWKAWMERPHEELSSYAVTYRSKRGCPVTGEPKIRT